MHLARAIGLVEPVSGALPDVKLRPSSYLMLGMIGLGARSGYAIKKTADISTSSFWPTSLAQVYPELARLHEAGLLERHDDPRGARARSHYRLTERGEQALLEWLSSTREPPTQVRDVGLLRMFFADALPRAQQLAMLTAMAAHARGRAEEIRRDALPMAQVAESHGSRFPAAVARFGADVYAYSAEWLEGLRRELEAEAEPASAPRSARARRAG